MLFDEMLGSFHRSSSALLSAANSVNDADGPKARELAEIGNGLAQLGAYIVEYVFSYCVPFDSALDESDERHFYMEREWRVLGDVRFSPPDVERVILPRDYASRLRSDLPGYSGQVSFSA